MNEARVGICAHAEHAQAVRAEFLLFWKIEWSEDFDNVYLAKNDHRWVTFISLKTITGSAPATELCNDCPSPRTSAEAAEKVAESGRQAERSC